MHKKFLAYAALGAALIVGAAFYVSTAKAADKGGPVTRSEAEAIFPTNPWTAIYAGVGVGTGALTSDFGVGVDGYQFSGRVGADVQISRIVVGVLAQYGYDHVSLFGTSISPKETLLAARGGALITDSALLYGLVGETWLNVSGMNTHGLTTGAGIEIAITKNWRIGMEYDHTTYDAIAAAREQTVTGRLIFAFPVR